MRSLFLAIVASAGSLSGCATDYVRRTAPVRAAYESYQHPKALALLETELEPGRERDRLLALLDKGMILHSAGRYEESVVALAEADRLADGLDVISVSEEATTLLSNERRRAYRGEDFERLMISTLQALNFAQLGKEEAALVEVRRVNERLQAMVAAEEKACQQLAIARYLGGVLYEDQGEWDSAFIDYQEAARLEPGLGHLAEPLLRLAKETGRADAHRELVSLHGQVSHAPLSPEEGQVVVVIEAGRAPEREPAGEGGGGSSGVRLRPRGSPARGAVVLGDKKLEAVPVTSLERVAQAHLQDRIGRLLARSLAGAAAKGAVAAGAKALTKDERVGALAYQLLLAQEQPDLRSWLSLPAEFQLARVRLPKGRHTLAVAVGEKRTTHEVEVRPRRISLLVVRSY